MLMNGANDKRIIRFHISRGMRQQCRGWRPWHNYAERKQQQSTQAFGKPDIRLVLYLFNFEKYKNG